MNPLHSPLSALIKTNFAAGLVVFLVALPLCLGIALASGAPPLSGIIAGIIGGIVIGSLSTSNISVSGPAAGLTAIVLAAIAELGAFELFLCASLIAGCIQLVLGFLRAGSIAEYIPSAVIEGMLAAIGIIIMMKELPYALGSAYGLSQPLKMLADMHFGSLAAAAVSMVVLLGWDAVPALKKLKMFPSALAAVLAGIALNAVFQTASSGWEIPPDQLVQLPVSHHLQDIKNLITFPDFSGFLNPYVWTTGITVAAVASIETLLSIEAADRLDTRRRITDTNRELRAQGVGNIAAALVGGLPITSVIVRSSANANAGATHKSASVIHGMLLLVCVLFLPQVLNKIPLAVLASVLILVGYKLARPAVLLHFWRKGRYQFIPFAATLIAVASLDLLKGVGIGLAISILFILRGNMKRAYYLSREQLADAKVVELRLAEEVSFLNKAAIKKTLKNVRPGSKIIINAENSSYIAADVLELIEDFANIFAREHNIDVVLKGFKSDYDHEGSDRHSHVRIHHKSVI